MLPFALKVVWFCLSFSGIIVCWVVLYTFSRAIGSYWGPVLYSVFATLSEGIFCLGMIYDMNPYQMPKVFCIVQTFVLYYSAWSLTGVCAAFSFATSSSVLWPSPIKRSAASTLAWKNMYYVPILIFPLVCLSISVPVLLRINAIQPTDDLHCDASHPEWGRFLGYAGFPMIPTIPCFFISAAAARRIIQLHRDNQRTQFSFKDYTGRFYSTSQLSNGRIVERPGSPAISPDNTTLARVEPDMLYSPQLIGIRTNEDLRDDPNLSPSAMLGEDFSSPKQTATWEAIGTIEGEDEFNPQRQMGGISSITGDAPLPRPNLALAIWRLILFQMAFFIIQCLAALSTIIDVAQHRPTPTPFGSQHVALVLVGWGPAVVFGHLPAVRRQLIFWKK